MTNAIQLMHVVLDFDGTCTQIPNVWEAYLDLYLEGLNEVGFKISPGEWREARAAVHENSPHAGWTLAGCPAAPAAADPYILADESVRLILRRRKDRRSVSVEVHSQAYEKAAAPWREDALETFSRLVERGVRVHIVSNSSSAVIAGRLTELLKDRDSLAGKISVKSDAGKFRICELDWDNKISSLSREARINFEQLPAVWQGGGPADKIGRPIYLRRGAYFDAINRVVEGNFSLLPNTVVCGDIWEMDLAMPYALGANVHLLDRTTPFDTYEYERYAVASSGDRAKTSVELSGLLAWL